MNAVTQSRRAALGFGISAMAAGLALRRWLKHQHQQTGISS